MTLEKHLKKIKNFLLDRYKDNLAAILIFGSANTGHFVDGKSDIDHMIFLKKLNGLDLNKERKFLFKELKELRFATQYFFTLQGILKHINKNKRKGWSTYITIVSDDGSKILYSTSEFKNFKEKLRKNPPTKEDLAKYIKEKDKIELEGYFKNTTKYELTKGLMSHLRRKLQIMNYYKTKEFIFDHKKCLRNIDIDKKEKEKLRELYKIYEKRESLSKKEIKYYKNIAENLTKRIIQS